MTISDRKPEAVFHYFQEISKIPRPSYHEKAISDYLVSFAKDHDLKVWQDELFNVIMISEATRGYEDKPAIILQGHMDMVCETAPGCDKDMEKEGPNLILDGDFLRAEGTTLGADDGIGVAMMLALLSDQSLRHPRLECIFTVSEEVGMEGAAKLDVSPLRGKLLLNLDSEKEGEILASCAGGGRANLIYPVKRSDRDKDSVYLEVSVTGGRGGHSGDEIHKGRGNATILLGRTLRHIKSGADFRLVTIKGGTKDNAIPREARAVIAVSAVDEKIVSEKAVETGKELAEEFQKTDAGIRVSVKPVEDESSQPLTVESSDGFLTLLSALPNGIRRMSREIDGLVETSLNLGVNETKEDHILIGYSLRSSVGSAYRALKEKVVCVAEGMGCRVEMSGEYPAWEFVRDSAFRERLQEIYKRLFEQELSVTAIHAGVECGLLSQKIEGLDAVSMGPNLYDVHTPDEHLSVSSTARTYEFVRTIIEE